MRNIALFLIFICIGLPVAAQNLSTQKAELQIGYSYAPDSSHILLGDSEQRRLFTADVRYLRRISANSALRFDYLLSFSPFFRVSDPALAGARCFMPDGTPFVTDRYRNPQRVIFVTRRPIGSISGIPCTAEYAFYSRQTTNGVQASPIGLKISARAAHWLSPYLKADGGLSFSSRNIPVNDGTRLNFTFSVGAGIEFRLSSHLSTGVEYSYMHISNANRGAENPGIDMAIPSVFVGYRR